MLSIFNKFDAGNQSTHDKFTQYDAKKTGSAFKETLTGIKNTSNEFCKSTRNEDDFLGDLIYKKNLTEPLREVVNVRYIRLLTTDKKFLKYDGGIGSFDKEYNEIRFRCPDSGYVNIVFDTMGKISECYGIKEDLLNLFAIGILKSSFADKIGLSVNAYVGSKRLRLSRNSASDEKL